MRTFRVSAAALFAVLCAPALAATPDPPPREDTRWLRGSQCLDPSRARGFVSLDDRRLLVDGGRNRYVIEVSPSCWKLDFADTIGFRGDPISGRVCGTVLDAVLVRGASPCRIEHIEVLSKEQYQAALRERDEWRRAQRASREAAKKAK